MNNRARQLRQTFLVALMLFTAAMLAITGYTLLRLRQDAVISGLDISALHSRSFEDFLTQSFHLTELVAFNALDRDTRAPDLRRVTGAFLATLRHAPFLRSMSLLDADGRIVASSNPANIGIQVATEAYLPLASPTTETLRIGEPWSGRDFSDGHRSTVRAPVAGDAASFIPVTRTLLAGDRMLTLLVALNPDYFINHFSVKLAEEEGSVQVLRYDGLLLMDTRATEHPGSMRGDVIRELRLAEQEFGKFEQSASGRPAALTAFRASRLYPFVVVTHLDLDHALLQWRTEARTLIGIVAPALLTIALLAFVFYRRQMQLEAQRAHSARLQRINAASVFTNAREGILITDPQGIIIDVNDAFTRITGYRREEALGQNPRFLSSERQDAAFYTGMWSELLNTGHWSGEIWNRRKNGDVYAEMLTISAARDEEGCTLQYVALFSDITVLKEHERQLELIAHYDALTRLPNRILLADRMLQCMAQAVRRQQRLTVVFLDLDGFKNVNDTFGHKTGDQLLVSVASRMKHALREGDTLARLGGDEFVAVLLDQADLTASIPILNRLLVAAALPVQVGDLVLQVSASLGVTFFPQAEDVEADQLLRQADQAMYQAKLAGKNRYHVFDADQDRNVRDHHEVLAEIQRALNAGEFVLHYQPKVNMRNGAVVGMEALIRWQHPERGLLLPERFLPLIEDHSLAFELGEWVLDTALAQMAQWQRTGLELSVSVNVGARHLQQANFVERLRGILEKYPELNPEELELEVLETSALEDIARVSAIMRACRQIGVSFSLDDFGTGYSSLIYLKRLPVSRIKIDQSFVRGMLNDVDDLAILEGVIGLAAAFHHQIIAEGVETVEHGEMLLQLGCEFAQGYGIARPMPAAGIPHFVASWQPDPAWAGRNRVSRKDLPLVFAGVEHRSWVMEIERFLKGTSEHPPTLDRNQSQFGRWMNSGSAARHASPSALNAIAPLHHRAHALGAELVALQSRGRSRDALARFGELQSVSNALLEHLQSVTRAERKEAGTIT